MYDELPEPIPVPWTMKDLGSAHSGVEELDDGRLRCFIRHDIVHGVTPEMLVWWFRNISGDVSIEGRRYPRYRVWHPRDHVAHGYERRTAQGAGPGAVFRIHEVLGRNPAYRVDVRTLVTRLDEGGFAHRPSVHGLPLVRMDYTFRRAAGGTLYENSLTIGVPARGLAKPFARIFNRALSKLAFPVAKGRAWLLHNIEEVGNFEHFLPALYRCETGRSS